MARFKNLVGCILNEFAQAQHMANHYAARLGREYAENDMLRYFMIPNACADGVRFDLKFAVNSTNEIETISEPDYPALIRFFSQLAISVTETAITTALYTSEGSIVRGLENYRRLKDKEKVLRTDFHEYLSRALRETFVKKGFNEVDPEGYIDHNKLFEYAMEVITREFFEHPDLHLSGNESDQPYFDEIKETCSSFIYTLIEQSCRRMNFIETKESEILEIVIDSESLSKIPADQIQQISFDVSLRNYQISQLESSGIVIDTLIPANS